MNKGEATRAAHQIAHALLNEHPDLIETKIQALVPYGGAAYYKIQKAVADILQRLAVRGTSDAPMPPHRK